MNTLKKIGLFLIGICICTGGAIAQDKIKGQIVDIKTGEPIMGATVVNISTKKGVVTDEFGEFAIDKDKNTTILSISYLGYKPQEIKVKDTSKPLFLTLDQSISALEEVVVIGYGQSTRDKLTGSITTVTGEVLEQSAISNVLEALQGRVAGMNLIASSGLPGDESEIQIRGKNSMNINVGACCSARPLTKTEPLVLIDGVPFSSESIASLGLGSIGEIDPLSSLNPSDVERIEILKDADATAIYGSRGSNGVILITTKKGI
ncbi:MAG: TonB-dependent receptor plug domain-containing protein [Tannerellaceae bacterium]|jgi:TonB-dependent SusC/RagA subfamily outer membrane receptor|nr:TonB-dependent receptor plug domain-containing protein [Tannerellaceae bacterium]